MKQITPLNIRTALLCLVLLLQCSCLSILDTPEPPSLVMLHSSAPTEPLCTTPDPSQLIVYIPETYNGLNSDRIALLFNNRKIKYLSNTRLDNKTSLIIQNLLVRYINSTGCLSGATPETAGLITRYVLYSEVRMMHLCYENDDDIPTMRMELFLVLGDIRAGQSLANTMIEYSAKASGSDLESLMQSIDLVVHEVMLRAAAWAGTELRMHTSGDSGIDPAIFMEDNQPRIIIMNPPENKPEEQPE